MATEEQINRCSLAARAPGKPVPLERLRPLETFSEQYPFFALRHMDWPAVSKTFRPQVTAEPKPDELLRILSGMIGSGANIRRLG